MSRSEISQVVRARIAGHRRQLLDTWRQYKADDPLEAEDEASRRHMATVRRLPAEMPAGDGRESKQGPRNNFLPVSFLANGAGISRAVARIVVPLTGEMGTGFLCAPGLLLTNFHVLPSFDAAATARAEFDFVEDDTVAATTFRLDPHICYVHDEVAERDYAIVGLGQRQSGPLDAAAFGWCPLSPASDKHALGEFANIIQHPQGRAKEVVVQDNLIAARGGFVLHYIADTEGGSSGSPVFNNHWQVIALHHWGEAFHSAVGRGNFTPSQVNEGIRISQIIAHVEQQRDGMNSRTLGAIDRMLYLGRSVAPAEAAQVPNYNRGPGPGAVSTGPVTYDAATPIVAGEHQATLEIPLRISISVPGLLPQNSAGNDHRPAPAPPATPEGGAAEAALAREGEGFRADFLDNHVIELPRLLSARHKDITALDEPHKYPGAKLGELQYTHFSVVMNKDRKMPFFGACNVDGASLFGIGSSNRKIREYAERNIAIFAARAEGAHSWLPDRRIDRSDQTIEKWYRGKNKLIPRSGTDDASRYIETADFDRGHIVRRTEPIWGDQQAGKEANRQTFNHANACPQQPRFNQDKDRHPSDISAGEEKRSWYGLEVAVLRAATDDDTKMIVFTGPFFEDTDPVYGPGKPGGGNRKIPLTYWKVIVWEDSDGELRSLAMKASQLFSLDKSAIETGGGAEALDSADELFLLRDFLTTVADIEKRTDIRFDRKVKQADILKDATSEDLSELTVVEIRNLVNQSA
ncbi:MAG: DNA/RNA non-specific endonuclease [Anderseniella sp.]